MLLTRVLPLNQNLASVMSHAKDICVEEGVNVSAYIVDMEDDQRDETEDDERSSMLSHASAFSSPHSDHSTNDRILEFLSAYQCNGEYRGAAGGSSSDFCDDQLYAEETHSSGETSAMYMISREDLAPPSHTKALDTVLGITKQVMKSEVALVLILLLSMLTRGCEVAKLCLWYNKVNKTMYSFVGYASYFSFFLNVLCLSFNQAFSYTFHMRYADLSERL